MVKFSVTLRALQNNFFKYYMGLQEEDHYVYLRNRKILRTPNFTRIYLNNAIFSYINTYQYKNLGFRQNNYIKHHAIVQFNICSIII